MTIDREFFKNGRYYMEACFYEATDLRQKYTILETDPNFFGNARNDTRADPGQVRIWYDPSKEEAVNEALKLAGFVVPSTDKSLPFPHSTSADEKTFTTYHW
jgi:hypothetical protein